MSEEDEIDRARAARRGTPFLNTEQAAAYLGLSAREVQDMRGRGDGPAYRRHTRFVRYHVDDLIAWSRSTSPNARADWPDPAGKPGDAAPDAAETGPAHAAGAASEEAGRVPGDAGPGGDAGGRNGEA